jgi:hypothetical protein
MSARLGAREDARLPDLANSLRVDAESRRRSADRARESGRERARRLEPDLSRDRRDGRIGVAEQHLGALDPDPQQPLRRRLAEVAAEDPLEVVRREGGLAGEARERQGAGEVRKQVSFAR